MPLPAEFAELEEFDAWVLTSSAERNRKRVTSSMSEIRRLYEAMMLRIERIIAHLNQYSLEEMPQEAKRLMYLTLSLAEVANAVELFGEPAITGGFDPNRFVVMNDPNP